MKQPHWIANQARFSDTEFQVRNPADTRMVVGTITLGTADLVDHAVNAALKAQPIWAATPLDDRISALLTFADRLALEVDSMTSVLMSEQGMLRAVVGREVQESVKQIRELCRVAPAELADIQLDAPDGHARVVKIPFGVVAAIVPWNAPISLATAKLIPALLAGNAMIMKPAPRAPLGIGRFIELAMECVPEGLIHLIHGTESVGEALVTHPKIRKIAFTGSTAVGRAVMRAAAATLKSVQCELGGNDAALILPGTEMAPHIDALATSAFRRSGQFCYATKRVYVHRSDASALIDGLRTWMQAQWIGPPNDPQATIGPVIDRIQQARLLQLIDDAGKDGVHLEGFGQWCESAEQEHGCYVRPHLATNISPDHPLVLDEQFGPILPIVLYDDLDAVINEVNRTEYGLSGSLWGDHLPTLQSLARRVEAARVFLNSPRPVGAIADQMPAGGLKQSGLGWEKSVYGIREYYQYQSINW